MQPGNEAEIASLVTTCPWMMNVLRQARRIDLPDWWIGAGFLRNRIWDVIEGNPLTPPTDIDFVYFDRLNASKSHDMELSEVACTHYPVAPSRWEIRNQARIHTPDGFPPYTSAAEGIAHWVETATAVAVRLDSRDQLEFLFCYGTYDLIHLIARPIPLADRSLKPGGSLSILMKKRIREKRWKERWPNLTIASGHHE